MQLGLIRGDRFTPVQHKGAIAFSSLLMERIASPSLSFAAAIAPPLLTAEGRSLSKLLGKAIAQSLNHLVMRLN